MGQLQQLLAVRLGCHLVLVSWNRRLWAVVLLVVSTSLSASISASSTSISTSSAASAASEVASWTSPASSSVHIESGIGVHLSSAHLVAISKIKLAIHKVLEGCENGAADSEDLRSV